MEQAGYRNTSGVVETQMERTSRSDEIDKWTDTRQTVSHTDRLTEKKDDRPT